MANKPAQKAIYDKTYRTSHKARIAAYMKSWYQTHRTEVLKVKTYGVRSADHRKAMRVANRDKIAAYKKAHNLTNRKRNLQYSRQYEKAHKELRRRYRQEHKEITKKAKHRYRLRHPDRVVQLSKAYWNRVKSSPTYKKAKSEYSRIYRTLHKERLKIKRKLYCQKNQDKLRAYWKKRRSTPVGRLIVNLRNGLTKGLSGRARIAHTFDLVAKEPKKLMQYLVSTSRDLLVTAENYGTYWVVDHIIPVSFFDHSNLEQIKRCWHFTNLQALEKSANVRKSDKIALDFNPSVSVRA